LGNPGSQDRFAALRIVGVYVIVGGLWILFSDTLLGLLVRDPHLITRISVYKGLFFILITAILLYGMIARYAHQNAVARMVLTESEDRFRSLIEQAPVAAIISRDRHLLYANAACLQLYGATSLGQMAGMPLLDLAMAEERPLLAERMTRREQGLPVPTHFEFLGQRFGGTSFSAVASSSGVHLADGPATLLFLLDLSEAKRAEELRRDLEVELQHLQKLESLGRLAGGVAHDMNNVLAAILGATSLLQDLHAAEPELLRRLDTIMKAGTRGRDLVKRLTDFARKGIEAPHRLDLNDLVRAEVELLRHTTLHRLELVLALEATQAEIMGDPSALGNVLMNLAVNAMDAMPSGGQLLFTTRDLPSGRVELSVRDTGHGMSPEVRARALDPFYTTKPQGKGTGLGLSIVYGALQAHGGTVDVESEPGQGTTIRLSFPVEGEGARVNQAASAEAPLTATRPLRVLLVDDDALLRDTLTDILARLGHMVRTADDGRTALADLTAGPGVDLVILDQNMPGLTGVETLAILREGLPDLPVILASGFLEAPREALLDLDPRVWRMQKPFTLLDLQRTLASIFNPR
jgi:PAS domain S-box-containing protein